jgi:hypothetical protein
VTWDERAMSGTHHFVRKYTTTTIDKCQSLFGCHVAVGDVAPKFCVREISSGGGSPRSVRGGWQSFVSCGGQWWGGCSPYGNPPSSLTPSHRRSSSWLLPLRRRWRASLPLDVVARPEGTVDVPRRHRNVVLSRLVVM